MHVTESWWPIIAMIHSDGDQNKGELLIIL